VGAAQFQLERTPYRDILQGAGESRSRPVNQFDLADDAHPDRPAGGGEQGQFKIETLARCNAVLHRLFEHRQHLCRVVAQVLHVGRLVAGLAVMDSASLVGPLNDLSHQIKGPAPDAGHTPGLVKQGLAGTQGAFGVLALGDIHQCSGHPAWATTVIAADELATAQYPDPMAALVPHPDFRLEMRQFTAEMPLQACGRNQQVLRMRQGDPPLHVHWAQFVQRVADDLRPALVQDRLIGLDVPFPGTDVRAFQNVVEPGAFACQFARRVLAGTDVGADRDVFFNRAGTVHEGRDESVDPVQAGVPGTVADLAAPRGSAFDGAPHLGPEAVRMHTGADDVVALPEQIGTGVAADPAKRIVDLNDVPSPVSHRDDRMQLDRTQQCLVLAQCGFESLLRHVPCTDIDADDEESDRLSVGIEQRLNVDVGPPQLAVLGADRQLGTAAHAGPGRVIQQFQDCGVSRILAEQLARGDAQGVVLGVAAHAGEPFVDPGDAVFTVGDQNCIRGVPDDLRQSIQVTCHVACQHFGAASPGRLLPEQQCQQGTDHGTARRHQPGQQAVEQRFGSCGAAHLQRDHPTWQRDRAHDLKPPVVTSHPGVAPRQRRRRFVGIENRLAHSQMAGCVEKFEIQQACLDGGQARQQFRSDEG